MSRELFDGFASLPEIESLIDLLAKMQQSCFQNIASESSIYASSSNLIDGYIERHRDVPMLNDMTRMNRFRDWVGTKVSQALLNPSLLRSSNTADLTNRSINVQYNRNESNPQMMDYSTLASNSTTTITNVNNSNPALPYNNSVRNVRRENNNHITFGNQTQTYHYPNTKASIVYLGSGLNQDDNYDVNITETTTQSIVMGSEYRNIVPSVVGGDIHNDAASAITMISATYSTATSSTTRNRRGQRYNQEINRFRTNVNMRDFALAARKFNSVFVCRHNQLNKLEIPRNSRVRVYGNTQTKLFICKCEKEKIRNGELDETAALYLQFSIAPNDTVRDSNENLFIFRVFTSAEMIENAIDHFVEKRQETSTAILSTEQNQHMDTIEEQVAETLVNTEINNVEQTVEEIVIPTEDVPTHNNSSVNVPNGERFEEQSNETVEVALEVEITNQQDPPSTENSEVNNDLLGGPIESSSSVSTPSTDDSVSQMNLQSLVPVVTTQRQVERWDIALRNQEIFREQVRAGLRYTHLHSTPTPDYRVAVAQAQTSTATSESDDTESEGVAIPMVAIKRDPNETNEREDESYGLLTQDEGEETNDRKRCQTQETLFEKNSC